MRRSMMGIVIVLALFLPACAGAVFPPPSEPTPTEIAVSTLPPPTGPHTPLPLSTATLAPTVAQVTALEPTASPTETPLPEPTATPIRDWLNHSGRTADQLMYLGNPDAPVTMIDFSDFM